jgi:hypothetical protein
MRTEGSEQSLDRSEIQVADISLVTVSTKKLNRVEIRVKDNGSGIPNRSGKRFSSRFSRLSLLAWAQVWDCDCL